MTDTVEAFTDAQIATKLVILQQVMKLITEEIKNLKVIGAEQFTKGSNESARAVIDGEDIALGKLSKSDPAKVAIVTDREQFEAYLRATHPDKLEHEFVLRKVSEQKLMFLLKIAPDLVEFREDVIPDWLARNALTLAVNTPVPGVEVRAPEGVMSITTKPAAEKLVRSMLAASPVQLLSLPAGAK